MARTVLPLGADLMAATSHATGVNDVSEHAVASDPHVRQAAASDAAETPQIAKTLAEAFATTAVERDKRGGTPKRERDLLRRSGLLNMSVPPSYGGTGATWTEVMEVVRTFARVDGSIAHLFGFHHLLLATCRLFGPEQQWGPLFKNTVDRSHFWGNALNPLDTRTAIVATGAGGFVINGEKSFCSGAADADMLVVSALDESRRLVVAVMPGNRSGIHIAGDWDNMGQRQTDSGSVKFDQVRVENEEILAQPGPLGSVFASLRPCIAQLVLTNVYLGLGEGAFEEGAAWTRTKGRAWVASGVDRAIDDPYVLHHAGEFLVALAGARSLTDAAADALDVAWQRGDDLTSHQRGACALAVATAKVAASRAGLDVANRMFEITGARATAARAGLDRFWRNLRTHTLHDPIDYRLRELGRWALGGDLPRPSFYS